MAANVEEQQAQASTSASASATHTPHTLSSREIRRHLTHISPTDHLYLRLPSGVVKYVKPWSTVDPFATPSSSSQRQLSSKQQKRAIKSSATTSLGKYGTFDLTELETVPYGWTWEIGPPRDGKSVNNEEDEGDVANIPEDAEEEAQDSTTKSRKNKNKSKSAAQIQQQPGALRIMVGATLAELEETTATNEDIYDDPDDRSGPRLTMVDVQEMRAAGLNPQDIIEEITRTSSSFEKRTVYSQDKFIKKKQAKHMRLFTPLAPSLSVMADYHFQRWSDKVRGMRTDSLAQMMSFSNIAPGGRYIIVDGVNGLLAAACVERMGGQGELLAIHDNEAQPDFEILNTMNLPKQTVDNVLKVLHWAQVDPSYKPPALPPIPAKLDEVELKKTPEGHKLFKSAERERHKIMRRHAIQRDMEALRSDLFSGDWDGLLIACSYEPISIVNALLPYLAGSANLVIHSPFLQPLVEAHSQLRASSEFVNLTLSEPWLRRYQVLPGRTHPEMQTSASGGYLLHGIRVLTDEDAQRMVDEEDQRQQRERGEKREAEGEEETEGQPHAKKAKQENGENETVVMS